LLFALLPKRLQKYSKFFNRATVWENFFSKTSAQAKIIRRSFAGAAKVRSTIAYLQALWIISFNSFRGEGFIALGPLPHTLLMKSILKRERANSASSCQCWGAGL
ncbi:hypothetical protein, partial [Neolewinella xylanilytica]|uniref:hypothetical protein n=1 Tax=Neolewinella xylanilytica TaxID=1514080 RepID=UPI001476038C